MFRRGRGDPKPAPPEQELPVDAYLADQSDERRQALLKALETLDTETDDSDAYANRTSWHSILGAPAQAVVGETGPYPIAEDIPSSEFAGQVTLVKAAKQVVLHPNPQTVTALEAAWNALGRFRDQGGPTGDSAGPR